MPRFARLDMSGAKRRTPSLSPRPTPLHPIFRRMTLDILAIFAHRDDAELNCGGTLAKAARMGRRTGILDLTQGEMGTRGSAEIRAAESDAAARVLGVSFRENLGLPDAGIVNEPATREKLARVIRRLQPRVVICPALEGRHPDHRVTAQL